MESALVAMPLVGFFSKKLYLSLLIYYLSFFTLTLFFLISLAAAFAFVAITISASLSNAQGRLNNNETIVLTVYMLLSLIGVFCYTLACIWGKDLQESRTFISKLFFSEELSFFLLYLQFLRIYNYRGNPCYCSWQTKIVWFFCIITKNIFKLHFLIYLLFIVQDSVIFIHKYI